MSQQEILLSIGRVVYINFGPLSGKIAVVVDIVNGSRVIIDGPGLGISRQMISNKRLTLTRFRIPEVAPAEKETSLKAKIEKFNLESRFQSIGMGKKLHQQSKRAALTDFERFKVVCLKKKLGKAIRTHVNKNRKAIIAKAK
jgi:large subunit ribosomal protein L14e